MSQEGKRKRGRLLCVKPFEHCSGTKNYGEGTSDDRMSEQVPRQSCPFYILCSLFCYSIPFHRRVIPLRINHNAISSRLPLSFSRCNCVVAHATYLMAIIAQHRRSTTHKWENKRWRSAPCFAIISTFFTTLISRLLLRIIFTLFSNGS